MRVGGWSFCRSGAPSAGLVLSAALLSGPALAAAGPDFPASSAEADILGWIAVRTSMPRSSILIIEPRAVVALAGKSPAAGGVVRVDVREELIGQDARTRSALFTVDLDCSTRRFRIAERRMFPLPDLKGPPQTDPQPRPWAAVQEASPIARAWQAVCTAGFVFPYASQAASAPAPPPRSSAPKAQVAVALAAPDSPAPTSSAGPYEAVLGAYTVKANALAASAKLDRALGRQLTGRRKAVVTATVKGVSYSVLSVSGFPTASEASVFCKAAHAIPLACIVKRAD